MENFSTLRFAMLCPRRFHFADDVNEITPPLTSHEQRAYSLRSNFFFVGLFSLKKFAAYVRLLAALTTFLLINKHCELD